MNDLASSKLELAQLDERYALRKNVTKLGVLFILYDLVFMHITRQIFVYLYYSFSVKSFNFNPIVINEFIKSKTDVITSTTFQMSFSCFVILLSLVFVIITARLMGIRVLSSIKVNKQNIRLGLMVYPIGLLVNTVLTSVTSIVTKLFKESGTTIPTADFSVDKASAAAIIMTILYLVVIAPISEEIVFRGLILNTLSPFSKKNAVILSAILFALMHKNIPQAVGAFVIGIIFATVDIKANSIVPSIVMHSLNNMLPCLININASLKSTAITIIYNFLVYAIVLFGITFIVLKGRQLFSLKDFSNADNTALSNRKKRIEIFLNPIILIYIVILVYSLVAKIIAAN